jgi:hypothetical protein
MPKVKTLLEPGDVGRILGIGVARVRDLSVGGAITPVAITPRGTRLFAPDDVERLRAEREVAPKRPRWLPVG